MSVNIVNKQTGALVKTAGGSPEAQIGALDTLETEDKSDLVSAINEVVEDITTLQTNFQAGVDDVYNAIVAKGTTPASKSLSDVIDAISNIETIHNLVYNAISRASNLDMGETHNYRYVDSTGVPNSNSGTYTPTTRASNIDMGATNSYRYVNTNSVPNTNSATYATVTTNGTHDMGAANTYRYVTVNVPHPTHTTTYSATSRASNLDMGATHSYRYVNTNSVPNTNSATYGAVTSNGVKDMGATNSYRYVNVQVPHPTHTSTYTASSRGASLDMGATHSYRYVNTNSVPNSNSATYTYGSGSTGGTVDMGSTNSYRYVNAGNVYNKGKEDERNNLDIRVYAVGADSSFSLSGNKLIVGVGFDFKFSGGTTTTLYVSGGLQIYKTKGSVSVSLTRRAGEATYLYAIESW